MYSIVLFIQEIFQSTIYVNDFNYCIKITSKGVCFEAWIATHIMGKAYDKVFKRSAENEKIFSARIR